MTFVVVQKRSAHGLLLVVTDKTAIDGVFKDKGLQLDLSKDFYKGEEMNKEEVMLLMERARHIHLTGGKAVGLGVEMGFVDAHRVLHIGGMVHAEVVVEN